MSLKCHQILKMTITAILNNLYKIIQRKLTLAIYMLILALSSMISECFLEVARAIKKHLSNYLGLRRTQKRELIS